MQILKTKAEVRDLLVDLGQDPMKLPKPGYSMFIVQPISLGGKVTTISCVYMVEESTTFPNE